MVRAELARDPAIGNDVLLKKARSIDPGVRRLSPRQFHATFRLPALRGLRDVSAAPRKPAPRKAAAPTPATALPSPATNTVAPAPTHVPAPHSAAAAHVAPAAPAPTHERGPEPTDAATSPSTAVTRAGAAQREVVRQILQTVAREALAVEDRAAFVRLLDSLDHRAAMIMGIFRKE